MRHEAPQRTCVGCRGVRAKGDVLRVAATPDGVLADPDQRLPGRGAYLCPDPNCIEAAQRRKALRRALRTTDDAGVAASLDHLRRTLGAAEPARPDHRPRPTPQAPAAADASPGGDEHTVRSDNA